MQSGAVILYRERGRLALGVVLKIITTGKAPIEIMGADNKKLTLPRDRILFDCRSTIPRDLSPMDRKKHFTEMQTQISAYAQAIDLKELWELLEAETATIFSWQELAEFVVSSEDPLATVGALEALLNQTLYFKEKQAGFFSPRDAQSIEESLRQQRIEREKARAQQDFLTRIETQLTEATAAQPRSEHTQFLSLLQGLALYGDGYVKRPQALQLLNSISFQGKGHPWDVAFQLLVKLGIWRQDEELSILRYHIPIRFSEEALQASNNLPAFNPDAADCGDLEDLTGLDTFTIDDVDTAEIDDALSLSEQDGKLLIGVHIADAGYCVPPRSILDKSALARGTTVYLPSGNFPMLPPAVSQERASLVAGQLRPALSFFIHVDEAGQLHPERITRSIIRVTQRLSYDEVDAILKDESTQPYRATLQQLASLAQKRNTQRIVQGAIVINGAEVKVKVVDGAITTTLLNSDSPARGLVSECMIMANETAARYCYEQHVPALLIGQPPPDDTVPDKADFPTQRVYVHAARRLMNPSQIGTTPEAHAALGLELYTQVTSPLRRYLDLQMHHQLKHHLQHGKPLFDEGQLQIVAASAQAASTDARRCERESTRFWLLKFLEAQKGQIVSGQVVRERHRRLFVELDETLLVVPLNNAQSLPLGTPVRLSIHQVDARRDAINLRLVEA